jgi:site-specific recombinase XerD
MNLEASIEKYLQTLMIERGLSMLSIESYRSDLTLFRHIFPFPKQEISDFPGPAPVTIMSVSQSLSVWGGRSD